MSASYAGIKIPMSHLQDTGEFIPGAKKHTAKKRGTTPVEKHRLQQLWPEPDWVELSRQQRYAPHTLAAMAVTYWGLGTGPMKRAAFGITEKQWPDMYDKAVSTIRLAFEGASNETLHELREKAFKLVGLTGKKDEPREKQMAINAAGKFGGRTLFHPFGARERMAWLVSCMADLGWPENQMCLKTSIGIHRRGHVDDASLPNWRVIHCAKRATFIDGLDWMPKAQAIEAAHKAMQQKVQASAKETLLLKAVTKRGAVQDFVRKGPDYLGTQNVSSQMLMDTFKLRGVQFGESLSDKERQQWMNEAYSALHDLARIIHFAPAWIGLRGKGRKGLALAIGARGSSSAMAHYEPQLSVINLTREKGAGNLAHEWFHALDNSLCIGALKDSFCFEPGYHTYLSEIVDYASPQLSTRQHLLTQFERLNAALGKSSQMHEQAKRIENLNRARKNYWVSSTEMWARSFEAYIEDALAEQGQTSPWLVYGTSAQLQPDPTRSPYPLGEHRQQLNTLFRNCMHSLVTPDI